MTFKTVAPGVLVREDKSRTHNGRPDRYFTIRYRVDGKRHQEALGWASDGWNVAKAKTELARLKAAAATGEGAVTLRERREAAQRKREAEINAPTLQRVWEAYRETLRGRMRGNAAGYVANHLAALMSIRIERLRTYHIDALRSELAAKGLAPATVRHCLATIRQIVFWGARHGFNKQPPVHDLSFTMPRVDNLVTENLTDEQLSTFLKALDGYENQRLAASMRFALLTGVRRYAIFNLQWGDVDFHNKTICLRGEHAKSGRTEHIPLTPAVEDLLKNIPSEGNMLVFGETNFQNRAVKKLIEYVRPYLPAGFRPYHGLRHCYASRLAASGASLYEIQKLLTHGDSSLVQRYAHLANSSLRRTASIMGDVVKRAVNDTARHDARAEREPAGQRARVHEFGQNKAPQGG